MSKKPRVRLSFLHRGGSTRTLRCIGCGQPFVTLRHKDGTCARCKAKKEGKKT